MRIYRLHNAERNNKIICMSCKRANINASKIFYEYRTGAKYFIMYADLISVGATCAPLNESDWNHLAGNPIKDDKE